MPYSTIDSPKKYFDTSLYTGTGSSLSVSNLNFQPDLVWLKGRSGATDHALYDNVRGVQKDLVSNSTAAETTQTTGLTAFNSTGFTIGTLAKLNTSTATYCSWNWLGANTTASNNSGSITSTVSANTTAGFSIVSYTGTNANATVGHGLGVAPKFIIVKSRSDVASWHCYHSKLTDANYYILLNSTSAQALQTSIWQGTAPTSSVFSIGVNGSTNANGSTYIAYCFAAIKGFSAFGSYTGNGSTDGTFIYTGMRPAWVLLKRTDTASQWVILDSTRNPYNLANLELYPNASDAEVAGSRSIDILSNGFKTRTTSADTNASGGTYIYATFAQNPFVSSKGIPCTAR